MTGLRDNRYVTIFFYDLVFHIHKPIRELSMKGTENHVLGELERTHEIISYLQRLVGSQVLGDDPLARLIGPADAEHTMGICHLAV